MLRQFRKLHRAGFRLAGGLPGLRPCALALSLAVILAMSLLASPAAAQSQTGVQVDSSRQVFAVMCALHAAGYQSNVSAVNFHPVRARLRGQLLRQQGPATEALRKFYREHLLADAGATLSRYVSYALSIGPPPDFKYIYNRDELPPDALLLEGFNEILADFYREAKIQALWESVQPEYDREIRRVQLAVQPIAISATSYLSEVLRPRTGRTFTVIVEPMIGGKANYRSFGDTYSVVFSPGAQLPVDILRRSFLHFLLDPLPIRYKAATNSRRIFLNYAAKAPRLPRVYKEDFEALLTECLVRAVDLRIRKPAPAQAAAEIDELEASGYVLVRALHRGLAEGFEKQERAISYYFPELIFGVRIGEEGQRLEKVQFAVAAPSAAEAEEANDAPPSELELLLADGDRQIAERNAVAATATFQKALEKNPGDPRAIYGLAVAAALQGAAEKAKGLFQDVLARTAPSAAALDATQLSLRAWSHIYLGRIYDLEGNRELALTEYKAALAIGDAPELARVAARRGVEKPYEPPRASQP